VTNRLTSCGNGKRFGASRRLVLGLCLISSVCVVHGRSAAGGETIVIDADAGVLNGPYMVGNTNGGNSLKLDNAKLSIDGDAYVGREADSADNALVVSGTDAVFSVTGDFTVGYRGAGNTMTVTGGAVAVTCSEGSEVRDCVAWIGFRKSARRNRVRVTGKGSAWTTRDLCVGEWGRHNEMIVEDGARAISSRCWIGRDPWADGNRVTVTGTGSTWVTEGELLVGNYGTACGLSIRKGGMVAAGGLTIAVHEGGAGADGPSELLIDGGRLVVTNSRNDAILSFGDGHAHLALRDGFIKADRFYATARIPIEIHGGTFSSGETRVARRPFVVGDGTGIATYRMNGGKHRFDAGFVVSRNAVLKGAGIVDARTEIGGKAVLGKGKVIFKKGVVIEGSVEVLPGTTVSFEAPVVNNGAIVAPEGSIEFSKSVTGKGTIKYVSGK